MTIRWALGKIAVLAFLFLNTGQIQAAPVPPEKINELANAFMQNAESAALDLLNQNTNLCNALVWNTRLPLHCAIEKGWDEVVNFLLTHGANPNAEADTFSWMVGGKGKATPLEVAAKYNRLGICKRLLRAGANPDHACEFEGSALEMAVAHGQYEMAQLLLDHKANPLMPDLSYSQRTPLEADIVQGDGKLVAAMLKSSAIKKQVKSKYLAEHGATLLMRAAERGELEALQALLATGIRLPEQPADDLTLLQTLSRKAAASKNDKAEDIARYAKVRELLKKAGCKEDVFSATGFGDLNLARALTETNKEAVHAHDNEGNSLLHWSVLTDQLPMTDFWLQSGASLSATNAVGRTPLHLAAELGLTNQIQRLLAANAPLEIKDTNGLAAFDLAVQKEQPAVIRLLLPGEPGEIRAKYGISTPLHTAAADGNMDALTNALAAATNVDSPDELGLTPFQIAVTHGHLQAATKLLDGGAAVDARDAKGNTALLLVLQGRPTWIADEPPITWYVRVHQDPHLKYLFPYLLDNGSSGQNPVLRCVVFLLANQANASATNDAGQSLIDLITRDSNMNYDGSHAKLLGLLAKQKGGAGLDINERDASGDTALHRAVRSDNGGQGDQLTQLIAAGADVNATNFAGQTPLHIAAQKPGFWGYGVNGNALQNLLKSGANVNERDNEGMTPLHLVAVSENNNYRKETTQALLEAGANPNLRDNRGRTPVQLFLSGKWPWTGASDCIELLVKAGADLSVKDNDSRTVLHYFAALGDGTGNPVFFLRGVCDILSSAKLDFSARDKDGNTPLHLAAGTGDKSIYDWLVQHGAQPDVTNNLGKTPLALASATTNVFSQFRHSADTDIFQAAREGKLENVEALLKDNPAWLNQTNQFGQTLLWTAASSRRTNVVDFLVQQGARWDELSATAANRADELRAMLKLKSSIATNNMLLHIAAGYNADLTAELLLSAGANKNASDQYGISPLGTALLGNSMTAAKVFRKHGAIENIFDAVYLNNLETGRKLLTEDEALARSTNHMRMTLVEIAAALGHEDMLKLLLNTGASLGPSGGTTPLHLAAEFNRSNVVESLIERGANLEAIDSRGFTPLHAAVFYDSTNTIVLLLKHRFLKHSANPDARTVSSSAQLGIMPMQMRSLWYRYAGNTPLHFAASCARTNTINLLLQAGASINATNEAGMTPLDIVDQMSGSFFPEQLGRPTWFALGPPQLFHPRLVNRPVFPPARSATAAFLKAAGAKLGNGHQPYGMPRYGGPGSF